MLNENVTSVEIDLTYLTTVSGGDKAFEVEMMQSLTAEIDQRMQAIQTAAFAGDREAIRLQSHSLKNLYAMLGLQTLQAAAHSIEAGCHSVAGSQILEQVMCSEKEWNGKKPALQKIIADYQALMT